MSESDITSLNSGTIDGNTAYNSTAAYPTGAGYSYYDNNTNLVMNTKFGKMSIAKNTPTLFQLKYTVTKGQTWSDGTPIDAVDLLLSHIVASDGYSKSAGLGDPASDVPEFNSASYGGAYGEHVIGLPALSADKYTLTVSYDQPMVDWQLLAPGPSPVHALTLLAEGTTASEARSLTVAQMTAAKDRFLADFTNKNTSDLKKMGAVWSTGYDLPNINSSTNPLLLVSNGGFIVSSKIDGQSLTLVKNTKYKSGPVFVKTTKPVNKIVFKVIDDNTAAVDALRNHELDLMYIFNPIASDKITLTALDGVTVKGNFGGGYSMLGLRVGSVPEAEDPYTGKFFG
ncbi:MAG: hypothetical protein EBS85_05700, partial [Micrococcales bacterium]|nr:hypothetical protein [Micrococcales bacterium]